jgi:hypothetical protein
VDYLVDTDPTLMTVLEKKDHDCKIKYQEINMFLHPLVSFQLLSSLLLQVNVTL